MRRLFLLFAVVFVVPLLASDTPKEYDDRMRIDSIEGMWERTEIEFGGRKQKPALQRGLTNRNGTYQHLYSNGLTRRGTYSIDPSGKPPHLDWIPADGPDRGKTVMFIYKITGDTLTIGYIPDQDKLRRPQGFNDKAAIISTYKRVK